MPDLTEAKVREIAAAAAAEVLSKHIDGHHETDFTSGSVPPDEVHGLRGDLYYDRTSGMLWGYRNDRWEPAGVLKGEPGESYPPAYAEDHTVQTIQGKPDQYHRMEPLVQATTTVPESKRVVVRSMMAAQLRNGTNAVAYQKVEIHKGDTLIRSTSQSPHSETVFVDLNNWGNNAGSVSFVVDLTDAEGVDVGDEITVTAMSRRKLKPRTSGDVFTLFRSLLVTPAPSRAPKPVDVDDVKPVPGAGHAG